MSGGDNPAARRPSRRDRLIRDTRHDPYAEYEKPPEPTVCPECDAVFRKGRWQWSAGPFDAPRSLCPACRRIRDDNPAGYITVHGDFAVAHRDEILNLARNVAERERTEHPLKRIMAMREQDDTFNITTTDVHLARSIGDAMHAAYAGDLDYKYEKDETIIRVSWNR